MWSLNRTPMMQQELVVFFSVYAGLSRISGRRVTTCTDSPRLPATTKIVSFPYQKASVP